MPKAGYGKMAAMREADVAEIPDGSLLIADDGGGSAPPKLRAGAIASRTQLIPL